MVSQLRFNSALDGVIESTVNKEFELSDYLQGKILPEQSGVECLGFPVGLEAKVDQINVKEITTLGWLFFHFMRLILFSLQAV